MFSYGSAQHALGRPQDRLAAASPVRAAGCRGLHVRRAWLSLFFVFTPLHACRPSGQPLFFCMFFRFSRRRLESVCVCVCVLFGVPVDACVRLCLGDSSRPALPQQGVRAAVELTAVCDYGLESVCVCVCVLLCRCVLLGTHLWDLVPRFRRHPFLDLGLESVCVCVYVTQFMDLQQGLRGHFR